MDKSNIYNFNSCQLGDLLYYRSDLGYNLNYGDVIGECCVEAGHIDENARFWSINEITETPWKKLNESNVFKFRKLNDHDTDNTNKLYGHYGEWKKDNDGWSNTKILQEANSPVALRCKAINNNMYVPSANELHEAYLNQNVLTYKINLNTNNYWTSTNYNKDHNYACVLQENGKIGMDDYYSKKRIKPFIYVNESLDLISFDDNDDIKFGKSNRVDQTVQNNTRMIRLKMMPSKNFIAQLKNNLYDNNTIKGFKFNNTYFNEWPIYVKYVNDITSIKGEFYDNLTNNGWTNFSNQFNLLEYLNYKYNYNMSDEEISNIDINRLSEGQINKIKNDKSYSDCDYIYNLIYNSYFANIECEDSNISNSTYKLSFCRLFISPRKDFFCCYLMNIHNKTLNALLDKKQGSDLLFFGYTLLSEPEQKNEIVENESKFKNLKKCIESVFGDYNEEGTEKTPIKLPNEFYPEIINGELSYTYNIPVINTNNLYYNYAWDELIKHQLVGTKIEKLRPFILYKLDMYTIYVNNTEYRDKLTIPEMNGDKDIAPICIKTPFDCNLLCVLYNIYIGNTKYFKISIFDNTDFHIGDKYTIVNSMVQSNQWNGWRYR